MKAGFCLLGLLFSSIVALAQARPFEHIIIIVQENRSIDNLFGANPTFEPGVDIQTVYTTNTGQTYQSSAIPLANCYDLGHGHSNFVKEYANGAMNGFGVSTSAGCNVGANPAVRFVQQSDVQPYFDIATAYGWANRMFQTNEGASFAAHQFLLSGTSSPTETSDLFAADNPTRGRGGCIGPADSYIWLINPNGTETTNMFPCFERPTLTDLLNAADITWKWYAPNAKSIWTAPDAVQHMCVPKNGVCTGSDFKNVILKPTQITTDINNCNLASVVWVNPSSQYSDHPKSNNGTGPSWVASIVNAVGSSTCGYWKNTAVLITWDDWGGWWDHVPPPQIGQQNGWGANYVYGFRVPLLVVSAYTPAGYVDNGNHDFGSILRFVENNFGLSLIGPGYYADSYADDLSSFFPKSNPRTFVQINAKPADFEKMPLEDPDTD
jgi:phospholipase C